MSNADFPAGRTTLSELVSLLKLSIEAAAQASSRLRYNFYKPRDRYAVLLLYRIIDQARAVVVLAEAKEYAAIPIIVRSALDAYADVANLCDHLRYWEHLEVSPRQMIDTSSS